MLKDLMRRLVQASGRSDRNGWAPAARPLANLDDLRAAYRLLLGREPDEEGFATYAKRIRQERIAATDLADLFLGSNEYASLHSLPLREVDFGTYTLVIRDSDSDVGKVVASGNPYEPNVTAALRETLRAGATFADIGANIGYYTAMAADRVGRNGRVVAVEPMDKNLQLILATIRKNGFSHVVVLPYAASDRDMIVAMSSAPGSSNGEIVLDAGSGARAPSLHAMARRLDDIVPPLDRLDVVKIDIEGHELHAWRGFERTLSRFRPVVFTEFHPKCMRELSGVDPRDYYATLSGYAGRIEILAHDGARRTCASFDALMAAWRDAGEALDVGDGAHLDLLVVPTA